MTKRFGLWLQKVFSRQKSRAFYFRWYMINCFLFLLATTVSSYLYPIPYSIGLNRISNLGGYGKNPQGALLWNIFMGIFAVGNLPLLRYLNRSVSGLISAFQSNISPVSSEYLEGSDVSDVSDVSHISLNKFHSFSRWWNFLGYAGLFGMVGVAIFPEDLGMWHVIPALMAFFGLILWLNWQGYALSYIKILSKASVQLNIPDEADQQDQSNRQNSVISPLSASSSSKLKFLQLQIPVPTIRLSRIFLAILDISFIIALFFSMVDIPYHGSSPVLAIILDFPIWEWATFCQIFLSLGFFVRIFPSLSESNPRS